MFVCVYYSLVENIHHLPSDLYNDLEVLFYQIVFLFEQVKTWAEKEMRNLKRLHMAGIPCPEPHLLKSHVLIMEFLGNDG